MLQIAPFYKSKMNGAVEMDGRRASPRTVNQMHIRVSRQEKTLGIRYRKPRTVNGYLVYGPCTYTPFLHRRDISMSGPWHDGI